jgi:hypothetical protein
METEWMEAETVTRRGNAAGFSQEIQHYGNRVRVDGLRNRWV